MEIRGFFRDAIHNISVGSFEHDPIIRLETTGSDKSDCTMGGISQVYLGFHKIMNQENIIPKS